MFNLPSCARVSRYRAANWRESERERENEGDRRERKRDRFSSYAVITFWDIVIGNLVLY